MTIAQIMHPIEPDLHRVRETMAEVLRQRAHSKQLLKVKDHALDNGKMLRPAIVLHCGRALGAPIDVLVHAAAAVELLHMATLIHDDVVDNAALRRNKATLRETMGNKMAVLGGDFCLASSLRCAAKLGNAAVLELAEAVIRIVEGEMSQAAGSFRLELTLDEYIERIAGKTGALFALSMKLAAIAADAPHTIRALAGQFGHYLGIVFQMRDDYLDLFGSTACLGKTIANDLAQGTVTLPLILAQRLKPNPELENLFAAGTLAIDVLPAVRHWVTSSGAEREALEVMQHYAALAIAALSCLPLGESRDALGSCVEIALNRKS